MPTNLEETVARAINDADHIKGGLSADELWSRETRRDVCRNLAQAALAAIRETHAIVPREPTGEMCLAGMGRDPITEVLEPSNPSKYYGDIYKAMIEAGEVK